MATGSVFSQSLSTYVQALVDYAQLIDDVDPLKDLAKSLFAKIQAGDGKTMIRTAPVGKSFEFQITMTVEEQFAAVVQAIKIFRGAAGDGPITFIDFSRIDTRTPNSLPLDPLLY